MPSPSELIKLVGGVARKGGAATSELASIEWGGAATRAASAPASSGPAVQDGFIAAAKGRLQDPARYLNGTEAKERVLAGRGVFEDPVFWKSIPSDPAVVQNMLRKWYPSLARYHYLID